MDFSRACRAVAAAVTTMALLNLALLPLSDLFTTDAPLAMYELVPGVWDTGLFSGHCERGTGAIQLLLGFALAIGLVVSRHRVGLRVVATACLNPFSLFHSWEVSVGVFFPSVVPRDFPVTAIPAHFRVLLSARAIRHPQTKKFATAPNRLRLQQ